MEFSAATGWWVLAGVMVAAEMLTGTFYLLMLAVGAAAGAIGAHLGLGFTAQMIAAAVVGGGATALWHFNRASNPKSAPASSNPDVILDIGQVVRVEAWKADGTARVLYRGASWEVSHQGEGTPMPGEHQIVSVQGNVLGLALVRR